jgi:hypothetical protein
MAVSMMMTVFWNVEPCSIIAVVMEAVSTSEESVNFYKTTRKTVMFKVSGVLTTRENHLIFLCHLSMLAAIKLSSEIERETL